MRAWPCVTVSREPASRCPSLHLTHAPTCPGFQFLPSRLSVFVRDESAVFKMQKLAEFIIKVVAGVIVCDLHSQLDRYMAKGRCVRACVRACVRGCVRACTQAHVVE